MQSFFKRHVPFRVQNNKALPPLKKKKKKCIENDKKKKNVPYLFYWILKCACR